jgi:tetratricopeptide (TPR) repeat protein
MQFSPDGRTLGTGCSDRMIRLWSTASWTEVATMNDPKLDFGGAFSPDGSRLFTGDAEGGIRVWRAATPAEANADAARVEYQRAVDRAERLNNLVEAIPPAEKLRTWAEAIPPLDWLIRAQPKEASYPIRRGHALLQLGQWNKAAADLARGLALGSDDLGARADLARAQLAIGNIPAYRKACVALLDRMDAYDTDDSYILNDAAFVCALTPQEVHDRSRPARLAEKAYALWPQGPGIRTTLGATLYRAGRFDAAIRQLNQQIVHDPQGVAPEDWLFLAMAHHALGHPDPARQYLDRAERWIDAAMRAKPGAADASLPWDRRLQLQFLRREAERLLRTSR